MGFFGKTRRGPQRTPLLRVLGWKRAQLAWAIQSDPTVRDECTTPASKVACSASLRRASLNLCSEEKQSGLFQGFCHPAQKACGVGAVNQPMIIRERQGQDLARLKCAVDLPWFRAEARDA
jgi:hypothetical protein